MALETRRAPPGSHEARFRRSARPRISRANCYAGAMDALREQRLEIARHPDEDDASIEARLRRWLYRCT